MTQQDRALLERLAKAQEQANLAQVRTSTNLDNLANDVAKLSRSLPTVIELSVKVETMQKVIDANKLDADNKFGRIWKVFIAIVGVITATIFTRIWKGVLK